MEHRARCDSTPFGSLHGSDRSDRPCCRIGSRNRRRDDYHLRRESSAGSLDLHDVLSVDSPSVVCPASVRADADCRAGTGKGTIHGLGNVTATYRWYFTTSGGNCLPGLVQPFATRLGSSSPGRARPVSRSRPETVASTWNPSVTKRRRSLSPADPARMRAQREGRLEPSLSGGRGTDTVTGSLAVPGLEFDLAPPTFTGANTKTVRAAKGAKRARVTYTVAARDGVDGLLATTWVPRAETGFRSGVRSSHARRPTRAAISHG
jgi:hypothetical protein